MEDRILPLEGVTNFRDFGGYEGAGGRPIRKKALFRSAQFDEASPGDIEKLDQLNIRLQADLRRPDERQRLGLRWPVEGVQVVLSDKGHADEAPHAKFLSRVTASPEDAENWMIEFYSDAPYHENLSETYRAWFGGLLSLGEAGSAVVNCAAGKDRTGILCALTHHTLGVDRDAMFADYELTNLASDVEGRLPESAARINKAIGKDYDKEVFRPFLGVRPAYLEAALTSITQKSGSIETYLAETLGVGAKEVEQLRSCFLEGA